MTRMSTFKDFLWVWIFGLILCSGISSASATELAPNVTFDTELRSQVAGTENSDLGTNDSGHSSIGALEAKGKLTAHFNDDALLFWEGRGVVGAGRAGFETEDTGQISTTRDFFEWRQSYLQFNNLGGNPVSVKAGRQRIADPYGDWWNQDFDAVRVSYDTTLFKGFLAGGQNLMSYQTGPGDFLQNDKDLGRILAEGSWQYYYEHFFETRMMYLDDHSGIAIGDIESPNDLDDRTGHLFWGGLRAAGKTHFLADGTDKTAYRVDLMGVTGHEDNAGTAALGGQRIVNAINGKSVSGWGIDAGVDVPIPHEKPVLHFGYAFGSGDSNPADGTDHSFRQTGLQGNFSRFGALGENTNNYGTVLRPDLSNIHIFSAGISMPVLEASNIGAVYRYYRLDQAATALVTSGVENNLNGVDHDLGQGVDLLFNTDLLKDVQPQVKNVQDVSFRSSLGFFRAGDAFGTREGDIAVRGLVEVKVGF